MTKVLEDALGGEYTVTVNPYPSTTAAMKAAMLAAPLGDDVFGDDPTVARLEAHVAEMLPPGRPVVVLGHSLGGVVALALMLPLAVTSTRGWIRRLGKRWQTLHRLAYASAAAGVIHYIWLVKAWPIEPFLYLGVILVLLARPRGLFAKAG